MRISVISGKCEKKRLFRVWLPFLAVMVLPVFAYCYFFNDHLHLPVGCDEFGYLNKAREIAVGKLWGGLTERPFDPKLLSYLKDSGFRYRDYAWLIAPHAHHLDKNTFRVINQYPPGTGLLLSPFPVYLRQVFFPALCSILLIAVLLLAFIKGCGKSFLDSVGLIVIVSAVIFFLSPFSDEFRRVNSVAPTFGFLIAAGCLLRRRPAWSMVLLGTASLFRVINTILFIPFLLIYLSRQSDLKERWGRALAGKTAKAILLFLAGGFAIYLIYARGLLGNPFAPTYSLKDRDFIALSRVLSQFRWYLNWNQPWFRLHVIVLGLLFISSIRSGSRLRWAFFALAISGFNYIFFISHQVKIAYYPYASALVVLGILLDVLWNRISLPFREAGIRFLAALIMIILIALIRFPDVSPKDNFRERVGIYRRALGGSDVVWGAMKTGTAEYATGKAAFRFAWGTKRTRRAVIGWLGRHGYFQAFLADDRGLSPAWIESELTKLGLGYTEEEIPGLGRVIKTRPGNDEIRMTKPEEIKN